jgi:hypothetical protein
MIRLAVAPYHKPNRSSSKARLGPPFSTARNLAIPIIGCLTLRAECIEWSGSECVTRASGVNGVHCRQTPVVDLAFIKFDVLSTGITAGQACG